MARSAAVACTETPFHSRGPGNIRVSFRTGQYGRHPSNSCRASCCYDLQSASRGLSARAELVVRVNLLAGAQCNG